MAYCGAFLLAVGMAIFFYFSGFTTLMSGHGYGLSGFILLAVICPVLAGFVTFGVCYSVFSKRRFSVQGWLSGFALLCAAIAACSGLVFSGQVSEEAAVLALAITLFIGGRLMISRSAYA
jgi:hypothetical protein